MNSVAPLKPELDSALTNRGSDRNPWGMGGSQLSSPRAGAGAGQRVSFNS